MPMLDRVLRKLKKPARRILRATDWGGFRSLEPKSRQYGTDRGTAIDRHYIETFLAAHASDVRGVVLEVASDAYARRFGGARLERTEVVSIVAGPGVTIVGDLQSAATLPANTYDCIILTQTLCFIYDAKAALQTCYSALKPGGVLLLTIPGICQISSFDDELTGDYWRFTTGSVHRMLSEIFPTKENITVRAYGNVLAAVAFLHGVAKEEVTAAELDHYDRDYQLIIAARAVK
jgi:SAM-dependent methyltransferase